MNFDSKKPKEFDPKEYATSISSLVQAQLGTDKQSLKLNIERDISENIKNSSDLHKVKEQVSLLLPKEEQSILRGYIIRRLNSVESSFDSTNKRIVIVNEQYEKSNISISEEVIRKERDNFLESIFGIKPGSLTNLGTCFLNLKSSLFDTNQMFRQNMLDKFFKNVFSFDKSLISKPNVFINIKSFIETAKSLDVQSEIAFKMNEDYYIRKDIKESALLAVSVFIDDYLKYYSKKKLELESSRNPIETPELKDVKNKIKSMEEVIKMTGFNVQSERAS